MIGHFATSGDLIAGLRPDAPVHCLRPRRFEAAARRFVEAFPGNVLFAVKCNAHPLVLKTLHDAGIRHFDVASDKEIDIIHDAFPAAALYYHHPAKTPPSIRRAYDAKGVRFFAVDCFAEYHKLCANTGADAVAMVRMAVPQGSKVYDLSTKFGATPETTAEILTLAKRDGRRAGITFHVGSQCIEPEAYPRAIGIAADVAQRAGCALPFIDLGGGFPAYYETTDAPGLDTYFAMIREAYERLCKPRGTHLMCEPGRALVADGASLVTRVILRKGNILYLNDGIFGGLAEIYWGKQSLVLPRRAVRLDGPISDEVQSFTIYGPTCDGNDSLPYPVALPADIRDGDWIEFNKTGAYGQELSTFYNGLRSDAYAVIDNDYPHHLSVREQAPQRPQATVV